MTPVNDGLEFDPLTVPVRPAATVMLLDDRPDLHVLMLRRTARVVFAPDNWVFPGGRVDPDDHAEDFDRIFRGLTDAEASSSLDVDHGGLAWWLAACRETMEEARRATPRAYARRPIPWRCATENLFTELSTWKCLAAESHSGSFVHTEAE